MSDIISPTVDSDPKLGSDPSNRIAEVKEWLGSEFGRAGKEVPDFEYTPRSISHLHNLCTLSQAKTRAAEILAKDFRLKASEYRAQGQSRSSLIFPIWWNSFEGSFLLIDLFWGFSGEDQGDFGERGDGAGEFALQCGFVGAGSFECREFVEH